MIIDNSQTMTGDCYNPDAAECPEGFEWACCEIAPEFPTTPPMMTQCRAVSTGIVDYYNFTDLISMNNGQNIVMMNRDNIYGLNGFRYADTELNKIYDRLTPSLPDCTSDGYIASFQKLDEERLLLLVWRNIVGGSLGYRLQIINVVTDTVLENFNIPDYGEWITFNSPSITQYIPEENTVLISFMGRKDALDSAYYAIKVDLTSKNKLVEYLWRSSGVLYDNDIGALQVGDFVYVGASSFRNPGIQDNGRVNKFNKITGEFIGLFEEGEIVPTTSGRYNFGSKIIETKEHIVIYSGWYQHSSGRPLYQFVYKSYYTHLYIYDKQMNFIKKLSDETNTGGDLSHEGFGYGFYEYGNFILIGTPGYNKVGLYDKNFNFLYVINQSNPVMPSNQSGSPLMMTENKLYFGQYNKSVLTGWDFKICDY